MRHLSKKQIAAIAIFPVIVVVSILLLIDFLGKYERTIETFDFTENKYFISKNNTISYKQFSPLTPHKIANLDFNLLNLHDDALLISPGVVISVDEKVIKRNSLNNLTIEGNEDFQRKYPFRVGPDGINKIDFKLGVTNVSNGAFLGNYRGSANFKVSPENDELTTYSVWVAAIALGISAPVGFVTTFYSHKTQKSNELRQNFDTTIKAFDMISGEENKCRWKKVFAEYWRLKEQNPDQPVVYDGEIQKDAYALREKLNQVGVLYAAGALNKKILFDTYGSVIIRLWISMFDDISKDRETNPEASRFFEDMYNNAVSDWKQKHKKNPQMYPKLPMPYNPKDDSQGNIITRV